MSEELKGRELGWDDEIEKGADYVLLPEGEYDFTIESFERGRFEGSDKAPACPRAELKVKVETSEGMCMMNESLLLYDRMQWKLAEFFLSIGAEEVNGKVKMNWNIVPRATGRAIIEQRADRKDPNKKCLDAADELLKFENDEATKLNGRYSEYTIQQHGNRQQRRNYNKQHGKKQNKGNVTYYRNGNR